MTSTPEDCNNDLNGDNVDMLASWIGDFSDSEAGQGSIFLLDGGGIQRVTMTEFLSQVWLHLRKSLALFIVSCASNKANPAPSRDLRTANASAVTLALGPAYVDLCLSYSSRESEHDLLVLRAAKDDCVPKFCAKSLQVPSCIKDNLDNAL
ncbi:hypothetical protein BX666DRAFT_2028865 [Dichotomocladium elegans]|nr:hypothetical protein BX666DRAFT_2028865 [Dichotomocladium elegans]